MWSKCNTFSAKDILSFKEGAFKYPLLLNLKLTDGNCIKDVLLITNRCNKKKLWYCQIIYSLKLKILIQKFPPSGGGMFFYPPVTRHPGGVYIEGGNLFMTDSWAGNIIVTGETEFASRIWWTFAFMLSHLFKSDMGFIAVSAFPDLWHDCLLFLTLYFMSFRTSVVYLKKKGTIKPPSRYSL